MLKTSLASEWEGFTANQKRGMVFLLRDLLDVGGKATVVEDQDLLGELPPGSREAHLRGRREGAALTLTLDGVAVSAPSAPETLAVLATKLGMRPGSGAALLPSAASFWDLIERYGWVTDEDLARAQKQAQILAEREPGCATAWLVLARLDHRRLVLDSEADPWTQARCRAHFDRVLECQPNHPQAVHNLAVFLTDTGDQRAALELLLQAKTNHPNVAHLYSALAYAARTSGQLEVALWAIRTRDHLQGVSRAGRNLAENVYLYQGDLAAFKANLGEGPDPIPDPVPDFYRGYVRLVEGDREQALRWMKKAQARPGTKLVFEQLAQIYQQALEGHASEALHLLDQLQDQRLRLRVPDGEFTFKVAEAYGFLGQRDSALYVAERAFSQGFCCAEWYERSPFLKEARTHPRWPSLIQHIRDRQALVASQFPLRRFGS